MKKNGIFVCAAIPALTLVLLTLSTGGGSVGAALLAVITAVFGLIASLFVLLAPLWKFVLLGALGFTVGGFVRMIRKSEGDTQPLICGVVSGLCAVALFFSAFPFVTGLGAFLVYVMWIGISENKKEGDGPPSWFATALLAAVLTGLFLLNILVTAEKEAEKLRSAAGTAHRMTSEELSAYDAHLRETFLSAGAFSLPTAEVRVAEWAMGPGMTQAPLFQNPTRMVLDVPGKSDDLVCSIEEEGRVDINVLRNTSDDADVFLRRLCSLRIGNR